MRTKKSIFLIASLLVISSTFSQKALTKIIPWNHKNLSFMGRIGKLDSCAAFYWTGSNVSMNVQGTDTVKALLSDSRDGNYLYVVIDGKERQVQKINIHSAKQWYTLATFKDQQKHHITLFKITNTDEHVIRFYGFQIHANASVIAPDKLPARKIEFFGNSITCGHGVEVPIDSADSGKPEYFNNYKTYAAITARHFNAQYHCTAKSGIGIMLSWFKEIMPEIYDLCNPLDPTNKWDFAQYQPDIVVVNLFQNDSWLVNQPNHPQFQARFGNQKPTKEFIIQSYANFIQKIRSKYPSTNIICCLGNMDATQEGSLWPAYINQAVATLKDNKVVTHFFAYKNTPGHPKIKEQVAMANDLIGFIQKQGYWK